MERPIDRRRAAGPGRRDGAEVACRCVSVAVSPASAASTVCRSISSACSCCASRSSAAIRSHSSSESTTTGHARDYRRKEQVGDRQNMQEERMHMRSDAVSCRAATASRKTTHRMRCWARRTMSSSVACPLVELRRVLMAFFPSLSLLFSSLLLPSRGGGWVAWQRSVAQQLLVVCWPGRLQVGAKTALLSVGQCTRQVQAGEETNTVCEESVRMCVCRLLSGASVRRPVSSRARGVLRPSASWTLSRAESLWSSPSQPSDDWPTQLGCTAQRTATADRTGQTNSAAEQSSAHERRVSHA